MLPELIEEDMEFDFDEFSEFDEFDEDDDDDDDDGDFDEDYDDEDAMGFDGEYDDDDDDAERRGRKRRQARRRRRLQRRLKRLNRRSGKGGRYLQRRLKGYVKRTELQASLKSVGRDIAKNRGAIAGNTRAISSSNSRISTVSRVNRKQSKEIAAIRKEMADAKQFSMLMSLLDSGSATYTVQNANEENGRLTSLTMDKQGDELTTLLPLLMSSGGSGGGFDNPLMLLLLLGNR